MNNKTKSEIIEEIRELRMVNQKYRDELENSPDRSQFAELMLHEMIARSPISIQILDKDGVTVSVNKAHTEFFDSLPPAGYNLFKDPLLIEQGIDEVFRKLQKGEAVFFPDTWYNVHELDPSLPNKMVWVKSLGFPIFDKNNRPERYVIMHENITERKQNEEKLQLLNEELRLMTEYNEQVREDERKKLARELHDDFGIPLSTINMRLELIKQKMNDKDMIAELDKILFIIKNTDTAVQKILSNLRSVIIEDLGIKAAMEAYVEEFATGNKIQVYLDIDRDLELGYEASFVIYKILQGALSNVARHSEADTVDIWLNHNDDILDFIVSDNGIGITEEQIHSNKSFGITGMRERVAKMNGTFEICCSENRGTTLTVRLPYIK
jgi:two-component system, NarL family, sensor histidine kinase UhpB